MRVEMFDAKTVVVSVVAVLSVFVQPGIRGQPTIGFTSADDSCSKLEEECEFQVVENARLQSLLESERQTIKNQENVSYSQAEEIQRLNQKLENKQQKIDKLENISSDQTVENQRLNLVLENKEHRIEILENVSRSRAEENHQLNMELENKEQKIVTLENVSSSRAEKNHQLNMELENKQQKIDTLENVSYTQAEEINRLNLEMENIQQKMDTLGNVSNYKAEQNQRLNLELLNKQQLIATLGNVSSAQTKENQRLNLELRNKQQLIATLRNVSSNQTKEIRRLNLELVERRRLRARELQSVRATSVSSFDVGRSHSGITQVEDKIYVLSYNPSIIKVHEDMTGFRFVKDIALTGISTPWDIVYSNESKYVYISDSNQKCIWAMTTTGEHRLNKWLTYDIFDIKAISLSNEGHLLVLRGESLNFSQCSLGIYSLNATLIRRISLPQEVKVPRHVVQTSVGDFIIIHRMNTSSGQLVISKLTNYGQLIYRFTPRNPSKELNDPYHLSLDSNNNRLFVADYSSKRVILFDSIDLTWSQVLLSRETTGIFSTWRLFYDARKKYLFVGEYLVRVTAFKID